MIKDNVKKPLTGDVQGCQSVDTGVNVLLKLEEEQRKETELREL